MEQYYWLLEDMQKVLGLSKDTINYYSKVR